MYLGASESFGAPVGLKETSSFTVSRGTKPPGLDTVLATASVIGSADHQLSHAEAEEKELEINKVNEVDTDLKAVEIETAFKRSKQSKAH